ncbi:MAG TPA: hypothetical protein VLF62_03050 [Candidatus Saccharimonadales bacterium]|nr:hypothetical protein [Candidatus Saccharimonadales bacterium]
MKIWQRLALFTTALFAVAAVAASVPVVHSAAQGVFDVCKQGGASGSAVCHAPTGNNLSGSNGIIVKVANIFAFVGGIAAVFVLIVGGFMYITSGGDSGKANSGRSAVIYSMVGLVVIVLGRVIIGFVVTKIK